MIYRGFKHGQRVRVGARRVYGVITGVIEKPDGSYTFMVLIDQGGSGRRECAPAELRAVRQVRPRKGAH
jgi:hypothetical protein